MAPLTLHAPSLASCTDLAVDETNYGCGTTRRSTQACVASARRRIVEIVLAAEVRFAAPADVRLVVRYVP